MTLTLAQLFRPGAHSGIPSFTNHSNVAPVLVQRDLERSRFELVGKGYV